MNNFLTNNQTRYKVWRTIVQAIISWLVVDGGSNLLEIIAHIPVEGWIKTLLFGVIMAILAGVMPYIGSEEITKEDVPHGFFDGEEVSDDEGDSEQDLEDSE